MEQSEDSFTSSSKKRKLVTSDTITEGFSEEETDELNSLFETEIQSTDAVEIAVISDIHSNMVAFEAVLEDLKDRDYEIILSLGDLVGYYTQPMEVIQECYDLFDFRVMGNHDFAAIEPKDLMFSTLNKNAQHALMKNKTELDKKSKSYLATQPMKLILDTPYGAITMVHGDPLTIFGYIYGNTEQQMEEEILKALNHVNTEYLFVGHTHIQGKYTSESGKTYLNPGAVGQPRDGDPRAAYSTINLATHEIDLIRVEYDVSEVQNKIHQCKFPDYLAKRLEKGI